ncbi:aminoglycoside/hydroxyurea antibiotic resistance kinase [Legionella israelensis]|uniref:Aminoglycoside/hydroxyurea antibiotic resistance kinase n=1 Tax=Legionella israelensis TaxID=454 RepID=A0AAX1EDJ2_9GAMM|nr:aminoglycoside phosphotransferase family protein [Legionella israelensis]QBR82929.1 aminoglycoside/hydroxyurea antibiotic resistance kinase [Legionella israelensis]
MNTTKLKETICSVHGQKGLAWWNNLPHLLENLAHRHKLTLRSPFNDLSFNYVLSVLGPNQEEWVLKLCVPHNEFVHEIRALKHYNGVGCVSLISAAPEEGWMIIERAIPGSRLLELRDEQQSIPIAVSLMRQLWRPLNNPEHFISLKQWLRGLKQLESHALLKKLVAKKLREFITSQTQELLTSQGEAVLLHADLHHYNILRHHDQWLAIDPKGVVGEREFEIGAFLRNPLCVVEGPLETKAIARNLDLIIELTGFDRQRVLSWCIIQAILCVCWYCEDNMSDKAHQLSAYAKRLYSLFEP